MLMLTMISIFQFHLLRMSRMPEAIALVNGKAYKTQFNSHQTMQLKILAYLLRDSENTAVQWLKRFYTM